MKLQPWGVRMTRICATLGPASSSSAALTALVRAGMDLARLNFSHGRPEEHARVVRRLRAVARKAGRPIGVMQDLQGPRIRLGEIKDGAVVLQPRSSVRIVCGPAGRRLVGDEHALSLSYAGLPKDVRRGERLLLKDGSVLLRVDSVRGDVLQTTVERGGRVTTHAGLNAPDSRLRVPALTARDLAHLDAGVAMGVDAVALSFVRDARDVHRAREYLRARGSDALVIAKIERAEALLNLDEILVAADGVIVARGDLGVECPVETVPLLQKDIIRRSMERGTFVITATQMLESMTSSETPTRAEVSDVANAILDGTDAVMLSGETAVGKHPAAAVATMDRIARAVEGNVHLDGLRVPRASLSPSDFVSAVARSGVELAELAGARALIPFTATGRTAALLSAVRPSIPMFALTYHDAVCRRLNFYRGVFAQRIPMSSTLDRLFVKGVEHLRKGGFVHRGDVVVLIGGSKLAHASANTMKVQRIGVNDQPDASS